METNGQQEDAAPREKAGPDPDFVRRVLEDGQPVHIKLGDSARQDEVTLATGVPIRGVVKVTIEDDVASGRTVTLRIRNAEIEGDFDVVLQSQDAPD